MASTNETIFQNIVATIDEAIAIELGEEREYKDETEMKLDEVQSMLKEALGLPENYTL